MAVTGTRPEIIKLAPVMREIQSKNLDLYYVHTGQHYDYLLSKQMITDLQLPMPNKSFELRSSSPAGQIAEIMSNLEYPFKRLKGSILLIQGDTNSVVSAALTAVKAKMPIAHIEAGLRSFDWRMPEEHNRRMVDHISDILFAPTTISKMNLLEEHVRGKIFVTGNTVIDAIKEHLPLAQKKSRIMNRIKFNEYALATFHRSENVDNYDVLGKIVNGLITANVHIVIPLHPRTKKRLISMGLYEKLRSSKNIQLMPPQGYLDFLVLMKSCRFLVTDSGGLQEEATSPLIRKRVVVLRRTTERVETIRAGFAQLIKLDAQKIARSLILEWNSSKSYLPRFSPFGKGNSADRIVRILEKGVKVE
jgi:UDP-N-acetylglucosamine 2-epimerase (non-hydrolysing)